MSTKWDSQTRNWWRQVFPDEKLDICENILFPSLEGEADRFRMLLKASLAQYFFSNITSWKAWETLCNSFHVDPYVVAATLEEMRKHDLKND